MILPQPRDATPEHAQQCYQLLRVSDQDFMPTVFGDLFDRVYPQLFAQKENLFSHQHTRVCVVDEEVAGMCYFFPAAARKAEALHTAWLMFCATGAAMLPRVPAMLRSDQLLGKLDPRAFFVSNLAVHPSYRGRGLATVLLADAQKHAEAINAKELLLDVRTENTKAISLYSRSGYQTAAVRTVRLHGKPYEYMRMRKPLVGDAVTVAVRGSGQGLHAQGL